MTGGCGGSFHARNGNGGGADIQDVVARRTEIETSSGVGVGADHDGN